MIDTALTVPRERVASRIGVIDRDTMVRVERSLAVFLGLA